MSLEKKIEYKNRIEEIDKIIAHLKTLPQDVRVKGWLGNLMDYKSVILGFWHDVVMDEYDNFVTGELQAADAKIRGEQTQ